MGAQYPVCEQISQAFLAVLQNLTQSPATSGYNTQLSSVERWMKIGNAPAAMKAVLYGGSDDKVEDGDAAIGTSTWMRRYGVLIHAPDAEASPIPTEQLLNGIRADVEKILKQEIATGANLGGLADNIQCLGAGMDLESSDLPFVFVLFDVLYRTDQFDPYIAL